VAAGSGEPRQHEAEVGVARVLTATQRVAVTVRVIDHPGVRTARSSVVHVEVSQRVAYEPPSSVRSRPVSGTLSTRGTPSMAESRQTLTCAGVAGAAPLSDVRRVQAFPAQQRALAVSCC